jgi:phospholipid-binding lipoprotein MlaA
VSAAPVRASSLVAVLILGACATTPPAIGPSADASAPVELAGAPSLLEIHDPLEPMNRAIYRFNYEFDTYVFLPVVDAYRFVVPGPLRRGVSNFFDNLLEVSSAGNALLQVRPEVASRAVIRFAVNSTVGLLGLIDVATAMGVERQREDFGQTLGWWGVPDGPYLVLPLLGPSGLRDATGTAVDVAASLYVPPEKQIYDIVYDHPASIGLYAIDRRHIQPFRYFRSGSPFEYELVRFFYRKQRALDVAR